MAFDIKSVTPAPNDWFCRAVTYEGTGTAQFSEPAAVVRGPTIAHFDGTGGHRIEMQVSHASIEDGEMQPFGTLALLSGAKPMPTEGGSVLTLGSFQGRCQELTLNTPEGVLVASEP